jgi:hypothetical protein
MSYLREADQLGLVWAVHTQEMLWQLYERSAVGLGAGISAMPSMHVAAAVLFALLGWRVSRPLGIAFSVFAGLILLGSVHLGWHYAVDGYISILATIALWKGVGWFLSRDGFFRRQPGGLVAAAQA